MSYVDTPAGFAHCVMTIKMADGPMVLFFNPKRYSCEVMVPLQGRPIGSVRVGQYDVKEGNGPAGTNDKLAQRMRKDLLTVIRRGRSRGTMEISARS